MLNHIKSSPNITINTGIQKHVFFRRLRPRGSLFLRVCLKSLTNSVFLLSKVYVLMLYGSVKPVPLRPKGNLIEMQPLLDKGLSCLSLGTTDDTTLLVRNVQGRTLRYLT
jgi:hypothetical protein